MSVKPTGENLPKIDMAQTRAADPSKDKLNKACHEMEGYFVSILLKKMHESAMKGGVFEEKSESATYRDMFDDAVAAQIGKKGSFGIADMLYRELSRRLDAATEPEPVGQTSANMSPKRERVETPASKPSGAIQGAKR